MSIKGSCDCHNIEVSWHTVDHSLVPRACQCSYCSSKGAAYVSKSGTSFEVSIRKERLHVQVRHGSNNAVFHECGQCQQVIFISVNIDGDVYGALNARHMHNKLGFSKAVATNFSSQTAEQKLERWRQNWCYPVLINYLEAV